MQATAAIYFAQDAFATDGPRLMGRQAAGESFLDGYFRHSGLTRFHCYSAQRSDAEAFARLAAEQVPAASVGWIPIPQVAGLAEPGCLFFPGPGIGPLAWQRRSIDQRAFSLCGITHTISSESAIDGLLDLLIAPVQEWDAVILTSAAVKNALTGLLQPYAEYLADRTGATNFGIPQLPVIPLGVDTNAFRPSDEYRVKWRRKLGIGDGDAVALYMGRLSFHAKAHPFPMLAGLEMAAKKTGQRIHLVQAGWFATSSIENLFLQNTRAWAPSVVTHFVDGRNPDVRREIWSVADIFVSLADNIQETFGLSPVEAMAAGLPCVVTDWDGYKETVRDGVDGFRIPTLMPQVGLGLDLAQRFSASVDDYDMYIGKTGQIVAVDVDAAARAFEILVSNPDRRRQMGSAAQARAREMFDWARIVPQYVELWGNLAERRRVATERAPRRSAHEPNLTRPDPLKMFAHYPSSTLTTQNMVRLGANTLADLWEEPMARIGLDVVASRTELETVCERLGGSEPVTVADLLGLFASERQGLVARSLCWLAKFDVISILAS